LSLDERKQRDVDEWSVERHKNVDLITHFSTRSKLLLNASKIGKFEWESLAERRRGSGGVATSAGDDETTPRIH
jgi:hypothetical protein